MKKTLLIAAAAVVVVVAVMIGSAYLSVRANDDALEEIRGDERVVVMSVSGMT